MLAERCGEKLVPHAQEALASQRITDLLQQDEYVEKAKAATPVRKQLKPYADRIRAVLGALHDSQGADAASEWIRITFKPLVRIAIDADCNPWDKPRKPRSVREVCIL